MVRAEEIGGSPSPSRSLARFLYDGVRRGKRKEYPGRSRAAVEGVGLSASVKEIQRYLAVTGGQRLEVLGGGGFLPPTYPGVWAAALLFDLLRMAGFSFPRGGIVHLGEERVYVRPVSASERLRLRLEISRIEAGRQGAVLSFRSRLCAPSGQLRAEGESLMLLRGVELGSVAPPRAGRPDEPEAGAEWRELTRWKLGANHGRRYARVSGDFNPIHLWPLTAKAFGYRQPILHGYCIEALVTHGLIEHLLRGNVRGLRRLRLRFVAPVSLPGEVVLRVAVARRGGAGHLQVVCPAGGKPFVVGEYVGDPADGGPARRSPSAVPDGDD